MNAYSALIEVIFGTLFGAVGLWSANRCRHLLKERKMGRESQRRMQAMFPYARPLPLSKADRRGWVTDRNGNIVPR